MSHGDLDAFAKAGKEVFQKMAGSIEHAESLMTQQQRLAFWKGFHGSALAAMDKSLDLPALGLVGCGPFGPFGGLHFYPLAAHVVSASRGEGA